MTDQKPRDDRSTEEIMESIGRIVSEGESRGPEYGAMLRAAFALVALVGILAFVKGLLMFRAAADGRPGVTAGRAFAHMFGGVAAWHITGVIRAVQTSLGIEVLKIQ